LTSVVVIDDDKDTVSVLSELLELHGTDIIGKGYNGLEGVQLFDKLHPDVILLDLMMPQYDGLYALRKIREKYPIARVIIGLVPSTVRTLADTEFLSKSGGLLSW